jgi:hypothetical protein
MDLFGKGGLVDVMFCDPKKYATLARADKEKHAFTINRLMSMFYPILANDLNRSKINGAAVVDFWQAVARRRYTRVPKEFFTKTSGEKKKKSFIPDEATVRYFMEAQEIGRDAFTELLRRFPDEMEKELKDIEKMMK